MTCFTLHLLDMITCVVTYPSNVNSTRRSPHRGMMQEVEMLFTWTDTTSTAVPTASWVPSNWTNKVADVSDTTPTVAVFPTRSRVIPLKRHLTTTVVVMPSIWIVTMLLAATIMPFHASVWCEMTRVIKYSIISLVVPLKRSLRVRPFFFFFFAVFLFVWFSAKIENKYIVTDWSWPFFYVVKSELFLRFLTFKLSLMRMIQNTHIT